MKPHQMIFVLACLVVASLFVLVGVQFARSEENPQVRALFFSCEGCEPCQKIKRAIEKQSVPRGWKFGPGEECDIQYLEADGPFQRRYKIRAVPVIVLIEPGGKEIYRMLNSADMIPSVIEQSINKERKNRHER
jgi:thioredoxin-related protein